jgi:hypothetical protein
MIIKKEQTNITIIKNNKHRGEGGQILENLFGHRVNFMGSSLLYLDRFIMFYGGWLNIYCPDVY